VAAFMKTRDGCWFGYMNVNTTSEGEQESDRIDLKLNV